MLISSRTATGMTTVEVALEGYKLDIYAVDK